MKKLADGNPRAIFSWIIYKERHESLFFWLIDRQRVLQQLFALYKPGKCRICFILGVKVFSGT
jgi:hypothetical protein